MIAPNTFLDPPKPSSLKRVFISVKPPFFSHLIPVHQCVVPVLCVSPETGIHFLDLKKCKEQIRESQRKAVRRFGQIVNGGREAYGATCRASEEG